MAVENIVDDLLVLEKIKNKRNKKIELMLISDNEELKKLHYYIFSSAKDINYYTIDKVEPEDLSIVYDMDIIVYNGSNKNLKTNILNIIEDKNLDLKFFEISKQNYLRQKDILIAHNSGIHKLFEKEFMLEEFVMSIEMHLKSNFYTKRLIALEENSDIVIDSLNLFEKRVDDLLKKRVFFSLFKYRFDSDNEIDSYNLKKIVREYDTIYIDKKKGIIHFLILNTIPTFGKKLIRERIKNFSIYLEDINALSSFDLVFEAS